MLRLLRNMSLLCMAVALAACDRSETTAPRGPAPRGLASTIVATVTVNNTNDNGPGSLRAAIDNAQDGDVIQFAAGVAGQTIPLTSGFLNIQKSITIAGPPSGVTIDAGGTSRVVSVGATPTVTLSNLTITGGKGAGGGGILSAGHLTLDHVLVTRNATASGPGENGGGIFNSAGTLTVVNSTISGNTADDKGGGIETNGGSVLLRNSTVTGNTAGTSDGGGGVHYSGAGVIRLRNSIVANNSAPSGANCQPIAQLTYEGRNLSSDNSCGTDASMLIADPKLGALAANGGPTKTYAILADSPAFDAGIDCQLPDDQRYVARPQGAACDIGAYEFDGFTKLTASIDPGVAVSPNTGVAIVTATVACSSPTDLVTVSANLTQTQKAGRGTAIAQASGTTTISCAASAIVAISLAPVTGAFQNGAATASLTLTSSNPIVLPASATSPVKLFWGHK